MPLEDYGFVPVGEWRLTDTVKSGITFRLDRYHNERVIYAFAVDGIPKYVGVCEKSNTTLSHRMGRYRGMVGAGTNQRIAEAIRRSLEGRGTVKIWALSPESRLKYRGLDVDLVKGLENPLLHQLDPDWNIHK